MQEDSGDVAYGTIDTRKLKGWWHSFSCMPGVNLITMCSKIEPKGPNSYEATGVLCINFFIPIPFKERRARKNGTNDYFLLRGTEEDVQSLSWLNAAPGQSVQPVDIVEVKNKVVFSSTGLGCFGPWFVVRVC